MTPSTIILTILFSLIIAAPLAVLSGLVFGGIGI
jgi:hypothetical protein